MYGSDILCGISKGTFEISDKISYPYLERCRFYPQVKILELLELRAHTRFWNAPLTLLEVYQHAYLSYQAFSLLLIYHHVDVCNLL